MTNEEIRLAIAKAKGWRWMKYPAPNDPKGRLLTGLYPPDADCMYACANSYWQIWQPSDETEPRFSNWNDPVWWSKDGEYRHGFPNWPEDIAAAWELVEEMARLEHVTIDSQGPTWMIDVDDYSRTIQLEADTAPRAICLAWLQWKGEKVTE